MINQLYIKYSNYISGVLYLKCIKIGIGWKYIYFAQPKDSAQSLNTARNNLIFVVAFDICIAWVKYDKLKQYKFVNF